MAIAIVHTAALFKWAGGVDAVLKVFKDFMIKTDERITALEAEKKEEQATQIQALRDKLAAYEAM
jgi:hypothetical protein